MDMLSFGAMYERNGCVTDVCSTLTEPESDYSEKDQRSMLVWSPNSQVSDAMCK